jgi:hypothetical protein
MCIYIMVQKDRVADFSHRRYCFETRPFYVGFVSNKGGLVQISLRVLELFPFQPNPTNAISRLFITRLCNIHATLAIRSDV